MTEREIKAKIHEIIFEAETKEGKAFDIALLVAIIMSVLVVMLESVKSIRAEYGHVLHSLEWFFTILFTVEYFLRIYSTKKSIAYIKSFYGIVDLMAILPTYLSLFLVGAQFLSIVRALRLLRVFRVLKMAQFLYEYNFLLIAMKQSSKKIIVFFGTVLILVSIAGTALYVVEQNQNGGFDNIPLSIYWAIVTVTTVGFGDIVPMTSVGKFMASCLMIIGYSIIAIPTGIVGAEMMDLDKRKRAGFSSKSCENCSAEGHRLDAKYCFDCGEKL
jgi:voltage-gated potassium channel